MAKGSTVAASLVDDSAKPIPVIKINNVGPIPRLDIPIPESGVVVLRGDNGVGKSTAINAVESLLTGEKGEFTLKDDAAKGFVEGLGVRITVGASRNNRTGVLSIHNMQHERLDLANFIEPGLIDPKAADRARIKALVALSGTKADQSLFYPLFGGEEYFRETINEGDIERCDLLDMAAYIKKNLEKAALLLEKEASEKKGQAEAFASIADGVNVNEEHDAAKLNKLRDEAVRELSRIEADQANAVKSKQRYEQAKTKLDNTQKGRVSELKSEVARIGKIIDDYDTRLEKLKLETNELLTHKRDARLALEKANDALAAENTKESELADLSKVIEAGFKDGPTDKELAVARTRLEVANRSAERGVIIRDALQKLVQSETLFKAMQGCESDAQSCRDRAAKVYEIVSQAIKAPDLRIQDGRLVTDTERGETFFSDLSHGERTYIALKLGVERVGKGNLLSLPQEFWEGLDYNARLEINRQVKELGVVVITAEASDKPGENPISAEVFGMSDHVAALPGSLWSNQLPKELIGEPESANLAIAKELMQEFAPEMLPKPTPEPQPEPEQPKPKKFKNYDLSSL